MDGVLKYRYAGGCHYLATNRPRPSGKARASTLGDYFRFSRMGRVAMDSRRYFGYSEPATNQRMLSVTVGVLRFEFLFYCHEHPLK